MHPTILPRLRSRRRGFLQCTCSPRSRSVFRLARRRDRSPSFWREGETGHFCDPPTSRTCAPDTSAPSQKCPVSESPPDNAPSPHPTSNTTHARHRKKEKRHLPIPSTQPRKAAHLDSGRGIPDLEAAVSRPCDNALPVRRYCNRAHSRRVTRQLVKSTCKAPLRLANPVDER